MSIREINVGRGIAKSVYLDSVNDLEPPELELCGTRMRDEKTSRRPRSPHPSSRHHQCEANLPHRSSPWWPVRLEMAPQINTDGCCVWAPPTLIIAREAVGTPHADLSTRVWLILRSITHARHVHQLDLVHRLHESHGSTVGWVLGYTPSASTTVLGHAVP